MVRAPPSWHDASIRTEATVATVDEQAEYGPYQLAGMVDVAGPDDLKSPGALFLLGVLSTWVDAVRAGDVDEDRFGEWADSDIPVYTHNRWQVFTDLAAYRFESELSEGVEDMTDRAGVILYEVARALYGALHDDLDTDEDEDDDDE